MENQVTISTKTPDQLFILNLNGRELVKQILTGTTATININGLPRGIYFVKVTAESDHYKGISKG